MSLRTVTCSFCHGSGVAEKKAVDESGNVKLDENGNPEWTECTCPRCHGDGEYQVEYFACKIF